MILSRYLKYINSLKVPLMDFFQLFDVPKIISVHTPSTCPHSLPKV